jgi:predicted acylesterase/phospholipase RssA
MNRKVHGLRSIPSLQKRVARACWGCLFRAGQILVFVAPRVGPLGGFYDLPNHAIFDRGRLIGLWDGAEDRPHRNLFGRVKSVSRRRPELFDVLTHATLVGSQRATATSLSRHPPTLYLTPELAEFRVLDWKAHEAIFQAGREYTKREIESGKFSRQSGGTGPSRAPARSRVEADARGLRPGAVATILAL